MRILQLTDFYQPIIGGLERHVASLSKEFARAGHSVVVVTLQPGGLPDEEIIDGIRVVRLRGWSQRLTPLYADAAMPFHPTAPDPGAVAGLRRVIARERPDVVHSHSWFQYSYFPLHTGSAGPAHVVTLHDYGLACARKTLLHAGQASCSGPRLTRCLRCAPGQYGLAKGTVITTTLRASRLLHGRADRYIAVSDAVAEGSRVALAGDREIHVIPSMVPDGLSALAEQTPRPGFLPAADGYIMFAGALGPHKGVNVLLDARSRMRHKPHLVLLGTPRPDTPVIDDPDVTVVHRVPSAQVMASWLRASVAVVPSLWAEPMGQVAVEAMLAGRPVVASDTGGLRDVVEHETTGLRVPPGDPGALAAALDRLLDDPELRQRMGAAGRISGRRFESSVVGPRVLEVMEDAFRERVSRTRRG